MPDEEKTPVTLPPRMVWDAGDVVIEEAKAPDSPRKPLLLDDENTAG